eukprot:g1183.t1
MKGNTEAILMYAKHCEKAHKWKKFQYGVDDESTAVLSRNDLRAKARHARDLAQRHRSRRNSRGTPRGRSNRNHKLQQPKPKRFF